MKADSGETDPDSGALLLPVERFAEPGGSESDHTARFYQGVPRRERPRGSRPRGPRGPRGPRVVSLCCVAVFG